MARRRAVQVLTAILYNPYIKGFFSGKIYRGEFKSVCVPGLNCYSCPGALGACPIGSLQAVLGSLQNRISLYVAGFLIFAGALFGRFICGWACPFGLVQELLNKIPIKNIKANRVFGYLKYLKYVILAVFVIALPVILLLSKGVSDPTFCTYICPAGTLEAGVPLVLLNKSLQSLLGFLFTWKVLLLVAIVVLSAFVYRPFCRFICPLGAIYSFFNRISLFGIEIDKSKCTNCASCTHSCKMDIDPRVNQNDPECIRCGDCVKACKQGALKYKSFKK